MRVDWNIAVVPLLMVVVFSASHGADFQLPMWLDDTLRASRGKDSDKVYLDAGCTLRITNNQCTSIIQPYGDGCRTLFNFKKLLKGYWKLKDFHKITDRDIPAESFEVILLTVDNCKESVTFTGNNTETINFLDQYLVLKNATLMVTFENYHNQVINNTQTSIDLRSSAEFNNKKVALRVYKDFNETKYAISINGSKITIEDILVAVRNDKTFPETFCADIDADQLFNIEFNKFRMRGVYNVSKGFYLSATSITKRLESNDTSYVEVIIARQRYKPIKLAIILKGKLQTDILPFLTELLQRRSHGIPSYNKSLDIGVLSISNGNLRSNQFSSDSHLDHIEKGLVLQTAESVIKKRSSLLSNATSSYNMIRAKQVLCKSRDEIDYNPNSEINLEEFLKNIHESADFEFPDWLKTDGSVSAIISKVTATGSERDNVSVKASITAVKKVFFNLIKMSDIEVEFLINRGKGQAKWNCGVLKKEKKLSKDSVDVALTCDEGLINFRFIITAPVFGFAELLDLLKVELLPSQLKTSMEKIIEFEIRNFRVEVSEEESEFIRITGSPMLFGLKNLTMEGLCWLENGDKKLAVGIVIKDLNLDELFESIIGKRLGVAWIGNTKTAILLSNTKLETASKRQNVVTMEQMGFKTSNMSAMNHSMVRIDNGTVNATLPNNSRRRRSLENFYVQQPVSYQTQTYNTLQNGNYGDSFNLGNSQYFQSANQPSQTFTGANLNSASQNINSNTVYNWPYGSQSLTQTAYNFDPTVALLKTTDSMSTSKEDTSTASNNAKLMDDLVSAYKESNQEKAFKNFEQQREINEGVIDDANDKRSILPHRKTGIKRKKKTKSQNIHGKSHYLTQYNKMKHQTKIGQFSKNNYHRSRKRSEISKRKGYVQDEAAVRRDYINSHYISEEFKKDYLRWLQNAGGKVGDTRENIANIFDDVYSENAPATQTSAYVLANNLSQEQLSKYVNKAGYVTKAQVPTYQRVLASYHHNNNKGTYPNAEYMPQAYKYAQYRYNLPGKPQYPPAEGDREEYGTEKEAVGVIPETGADVYNLYRKRHKAMENDQQNAMEDDIDEEELPVKGPVDSTYRMSQQPKDHNSLHHFKSGPANLPVHSEFKTEKISAVDIESDESKQEENNDLIEEYAKLNAQLAAINEPTLSPIWSPHTNHQDEIQKKLYHQNDKSSQQKSDAVPLQKQPMFDVYQQKDVANYLLQTKSKSRRPNQVKALQKPEKVSQNKILSENDAANHLKKENDATNQMEDNNDLTNHLKKENDATNQMKDNNDSTNHLKKENDATNQMKDNNDSTNHIKEENDATNQMKDNNDSANHIKEENDAANHLKELRSQYNQSNENQPEMKDKNDSTNHIKDKNDSTNHIKEENEATNQMKDKMNETSTKIKTTKADTDSGLKSEKHNKSLHTDDTNQIVKSKNYRFIPIKVNEFRLNLKQNRLLVSHKESKSSVISETNASNSSQMSNDSNRYTGHDVNKLDKAANKSESKTLILRDISNKTFSKTDGKGGNATENLTALAISNHTEDKAIEDSRNQNDTEDKDDITIIATTGGHHKHNIKNKTKVKDSVFHLELTEDDNQTKLDQRESNDTVKGTSVNESSTHQNISSETNQSITDGTNENLKLNSDASSPSLKNEENLPHPFKESMSDDNGKVTQYTKYGTGDKKSPPNIDTHIEIYNGKHMIGRKNVTAGGNIYNNITEEDEDEKGDSENNQKPIDSHKFLDDLLPHRKEAAANIIKQIAHQLRGVHMEQKSNETGNVIHDENDNDEMEGAKSDQNSLLRINRKGKMRSKEVLNLALKALQISSPALKLDNATESDNDEDNSVDNVNQVQSKETEKEYESPVTDDVDQLRSQKHTSKLNSEKNELSLEEDNKNASEYSIDENNPEATEGKANTSSDQEEEGDDAEPPEQNQNSVKGSTDTNMGEALATHDDDALKDNATHDDDTLKDNATHDDDTLKDNATHDDDTLKDNSDDSIQSSQAEPIADTEITNSAEGNKPVPDDSIKDIAIHNSDGSVKLSNDEDDDYLKDESLKQTAPVKTEEEEEEESDNEKEVEDNENSKSNPTPIEIQEGEDTKNLDTKALTALVQKKLNEVKSEGSNLKQDDTESDESLVNIGGKTNEEQLDDSSRNVENVASILSHFGHNLKHNQHNLNSMKNKSLYLVKNKNLQVLMEIRPDSKTNHISVETQGLSNLHKNHKKNSKNFPITKQNNYTYVDQEGSFEDSLTSLRHLHKPDQHRVVHLKRKSHHQTQDNQIPLLQKELSKPHSAHNKEQNKQKYRGDRENVEEKPKTVKVDESIDDSISKADFDDSLVNQKYESILRPSMHTWKRPIGIELKNNTNIEDALEDEVKSDIAKISNFEANEDNIYLRNASPRTKIFNKTHHVKLRKTLHPNKKTRNKLGFGRSFTKMDDIIEAYQVMNSNKEKNLEHEYRNGMLDIKRALIPETSDDAYNLYNNTIDFGEDLLQSDELKHNSKKEMKKRPVNHQEKTAKKIKDHLMATSKKSHKMKKKKHKPKKRKSKQERNKSVAERKNKIHGRQKSKVKKENHSDISKNLQESMEGGIHYKNPIEEAIREYLYPSDDEELVNVAFNKEVTTPHKVRKHHKENGRVNYDQHKQRRHRHHRNHHHHRHHHRSYQQHEQENNVVPRKVKANHFNRLEPPGTIIVQQEIKSDPAVATIHTKSHTHNKHKKSSGQNQGDFSISKEKISESATAIDSALSNTKQPVFGNNTNSEESPGEQKEPSDILESFKVWIENTTTADLKMADDVIRRNQKNTEGTQVHEYTNNSTRKEVIGTTLKGKSRNLQFGLTQQKRADGKLHGHFQGNGKNETKLKKIEYATIQKNITKSPTPVIIHMNNSLATIASVNGSLLFKNNTLSKFEPVTNHTHALGVVKSLKNMPKEFLTEELRKMEVDAGISIDVEFAPPDECGDNKMCLFVKEMMNDADKLKLSGSFTSKGVQLILQHSGISDLTETMKLNDMSLTLSIQGMSSNIWIEANLKLKEPPLQFQGAITLGATGNLQFDMKMVGIWKKPFNIESLAIGNALLGLSYQPGAPMPSFELGGDLWFGILGSGNEIKAKIFFGFDPSDPSGNYFYGKLDKLSIDDLMKAFNKTVTLPAHLKESGFPKGLLVAFTSNPKGIELSKENVRVDFGFMISGTINILGYEGTCKVKLTSDEIDIDVKLAPIELAHGLIKMHGDMDDPMNGPEFALKINKNEMYIKAEGVACLLGMQAASKLSITKQHLILSLRANLFDLVEGNLLVEASTEQGVSTAAFKLDGCLSVKLDKLSEVITKNLNELSGMARQAINRVKEKVKKANDLYARAKAELTAQEARIKEKELELNGDTRQLLRNRHEVLANCFAECPKVCQGSYVDEPQCIKTFGRWLSCREYKPCVKRTQDLQCILKCENEKFKKRGYNLMSKAIVKMKLVALAGARISVKFAKVFAKLAKLPKSLAKSLLNAIEKLVNIGTELAGKMAKMALEDLLQVHYFCIHANLAETGGLCTGFNASLSIMKSTLKMAGNLCLNGKMFETIGNDAIDQQYPESKTMKSGLKEKEKEFEKLERESEKAEKQEHKMKDQSARKKAKRLYVPSPLEHYYEKILYEPEPTYSFHNNIITALYGHQETNNNGSNNDGSFNLENLRPLTIANTSCDNLTQTLYSYNEIANGLEKVLMQEKQERQYIEKLKTDIQDLLIRNELASTNMSTYDQQEYDWYADTLRKSYDKWLNKTRTRYEKRQNLVIPKFVDDLHSILQHRNIADLQEYMKSLHDQAKTATAGKRSSIITTPLSEEENLQDIRKGFDEILFHRNFTLLDDKISELTQLQRKLVLAQTFNKICTVAFDKNG